MDKQLVLAASDEALEVEVGTTKYHNNLQLQPFRLWLEQYWQSALVAEELDDGWLAVLVQQSPPLYIRHPFMLTIGAVETVGFHSSAAPHSTRKFGAGCRSH